MAGLIFLWQQPSGGIGWRTPSPVWWKRPIWQAILGAEGTGIMAKEQTSATIRRPNHGGENLDPH